MMEWLNEETATAWREEAVRYAGDVNEYVRIGMETNWEQEAEIEDDKRSRLAHKALKMIVAANQAGEVDKLRELLPPASWPLSEAFKQETQCVAPLYVWSTGEVLARTGTSWEQSRLYVVTPEQAIEQTEVAMAGGSADAAYVAVTDRQGIRVIRHPDTSLHGEQVFSLSWGAFREQVKAELGEIVSLADEEAPEYRIERLIPYDEGREVLLISLLGIYRLTSGGVVRLLHPTVADLEEWELDEIHADMVHGDVSPDGRWLAYGSQSSDHLLEDRQQGVTYAYNPYSSYPHFSLFSSDSSRVWFNACHFYNGDTIIIPLAEAESRVGAEEQQLAGEGMRVYAGAAYEDGCILGDAYGYLRYLGADGAERWRYFVGGTISGMAVSPDGRVLHVGTYTGMLHRIDLTSTERAASEIGTGTIRELGRWLLWKNREPLRW